MKCLSINVIGKVQGVYFRKSTQQKAIELGLTGTVMNLPDGTVQIEVVGEEQILDKFISWCHTGPERAIVKEVICKEQIEIKGFENFQVIG